MRKHLLPCKEAVQQNPNDPEAHYNLGVVYAKLGRYEEALAAFKEALRLRPDHPEAHFWLDVTYLILGNRGAALEQYRILKTLDPEWANKLFDLIYPD